MIYRLYRRDAVLEGKWYVVVQCKGCGKNIYSLDDTHNGTKAVKFTGGSKFSIPCRRCAHEGIYAGADLQVTQSSETLPSTYPDREAVSNSPRKPLLKSYPDAIVTMGVGYIEDRPRAAALVGRIVTSWADVEVQTTRLLAELMGANIPQAAALFGSLRSGRAQSDALTAVAEITLDEADLLLFKAYDKRKASLEKERNDLAHGCFGVSVGIPEHIVWVAQGDYLAFTAAFNAQHNTFDLRERQFVYEIGTLERIAQEIAEYYDQIGFFTGYLSARNEGEAKAAWCKTRYQELCEQSHIKNILQALQSQPKTAAKTYFSQRK